ncbi:MAG: MFS transporter [Nitriliruptoraceae bacterium]
MERLRRHRPAWLTLPVLTVSVLSVAAGIAQFSVTAVIGDVAQAFGEVSDGDDLASQIGLPTTTVGIALSLIRLASLASMPAASLADRYGRRNVLLWLAALGLTVTSLAAAAPAFWWYVALAALARPAMSTVNALAGVVAAEESRATDRSAAIALIAVAYGLGSGLIAFVRGVLPGEPSFRVVTAFAVIPLLLLPLLAAKIREPAIAREHQVARLIPGAIPRLYVGRVITLGVLTGTAALATGPGFTFLFVYGERIIGVTPLYLSTLVLLAGPAGLVGILLGRAGADRLGRRITAAVAMTTTGIAVAVGYAGSASGLTIGYLVAIAGSSGFAAPMGALAAELVPTEIRATVAGWMTFAAVIGAVGGLIGVGVLGDITGTFGTPTVVISIVVAITSLAFAMLPETRGWELDDTHLGSR